MRGESHSPRFWMSWIWVLQEKICTALPWAIHSWISWHWPTFWSRSLRPFWSGQQGRIGNCKTKGPWAQKLSMVMVCPFPEKEKVKLSLTHLCDHFVVSIRRVQEIRHWIFLVVLGGGATGWRTTQTNPQHIPEAAWNKCSTTESIHWPVCWWGKRQSHWTTRHTENELHRWGSKAKQMAALFSVFYLL